MPGTPSPTPSKGFRAFGYAAAAAALLGGFVNLLIRAETPPSVPLFACWSTHLRTPLVPDNLAAANDRDAIAEGGYFPINTFHLDRGLTADLLRSELERASESDAAQRVVYLSAYATCDRDGAMLLMTQDFDPLNGQGGLALETVLSLLDQDTRPTLLVLDLSWQLANGKNGLLPCGVGRRLIERLEANPGSNRLTLLSCSQGEAATTIPGVSRTTFGYFFEAGLSGSADGFNPAGVTDAWVSARELGTYVADRVACWTREHGPTVQTPHWIAPGATDFLLSNRREVELPDAEAALQEYPEWLLEAWKRRDAWAVDRAASSLPRLVRRYEVMLLDIEQRWRAGFDAVALQEQLAARTRSVRSEFAEAQALIAAAPAISLAQLEANGVGCQPELVTAWRERLDSAATPEAAAGVAAFTQAIADASREAVALAGVAALRQSEGDFLATMATLTDELAVRAPALRLVEIDALHRLVALHAEHSPIESDLLRAFFETTLLLERVSAYSATRDGTADQLDEAHRTHQSAWAALLAVGFAPLDEAERLNTLASQLGLSVERRQEILRRSSAIGEAALATLPATSSILKSHPLLHDEWREAAAVASELMNRLEAGRNTEELTEKGLSSIDTLANQLERFLGRLTDPLSATAVEHRSEELRAGDLGQLVAAQALLNTPLLQAEQRAELCLAVAQATAPLTEPLNAFAADDRPATIRAALGGNDARVAVASNTRASQETAIEEAVQAAALLRLAGAEGGELDQQLSELEPDNFDDVALLTGVRSTLTAAFDALDHHSPIPVRCRACRVLPAGRFHSVLDRRLATPTLTEERRRYARWADRTAQRLLAEACDLAGTATLTEAAQRLGGGSLTPLELKAADGTTGPLAVPTLCQAERTASLQLHVRHPANQPLGLRVLQPADCLDVTTKATPCETGSEVEITLRLKPEASASDQAATEGVLLCLTQGSRSVHHRIATSGVAGAAAVGLYAELSGVRLPITDRLRLPPTIDATPLRFFAVNRTTQTKKLVAEVTLGGVYQAVLTLGPLESAPLLLTPTAAAAPSEATAAPTANLVETLLIKLRDVGHDRVIFDQSTRLGVADPSAYVRILDARIGPDDEGSPLAKLRVERLPGSPEQVDVTWSLASERPGAAPLVAGGVLAAKLTPENPLATLTAALRPALAGEQTLAAAAELNGVRSAIRWVGGLPAYGLTTPLDPSVRPIIRLDAVRLLAAGEPLAYSVDVAPAAPGRRLQIGLADTAASGSAEAVTIRRRYDTDRCERVLAAAKPVNGDLMVTTTVGDWRDALDTRGLSGRRTLVAIVLDADGVPLARAETPVVIDADPADTVRIESTDNEIVAGAPANFLVEAGDRLSGIQAVRLYVGDPIDSLPPKGAKPVPAVCESPFGSRWVAALPLPAGVTSTRVTVEVTNGVGLVRNKSVTLGVVSAEQASLGGVAGSVLEGTRPQPGLAVELRNTDQQPIAAAKTNAQGEFLFEAVKPGKYLVWSVKEQSQRVGANAIEVKPGTVSRAEVKLSL